MQSSGSTSPLRSLCGQLIAPTGDVAEPVSVGAAEARALMQRPQWVLRVGTYPGLPVIDEVDVPSASSP